MTTPEKRKSLKKIAEETLQIIEDGRYGKVKLQDRGVSKTSSYSVADSYYISEPRSGNISVVDKNTVQAALDVFQETNEKHNRVCILNFASGLNPGGGFESGANAQEESLCRASTLISSLNQATEFYKTNTKYKFLFTDSMIYSPFVEFFRDGDDNLLEETFIASVITAAAPIYHNLEVEEKDIVEQVFLNRIAKILHIAESNGHKRLILGAWGCGAYGNDPYVVANCFGECLDRMSGMFEEVIFAIPSGDNLKIFRDILNVHSS